MIHCEILAFLKNLGPTLLLQTISRKIHCTYMA